MDSGREREAGMRKKLTNNLGLKILAVILSAALWVISININDPVSQDSYNVTVQMVNANTLTSAGKYVEVLDDTDNIRVTVRGSRTVLSNFTDENIVAKADLTKMDSQGMVPIELSTTRISDKIESIRSDKQYVYVNVENISKQQLPIDVYVQNKPKDGFILGNTATAQNVVIISGPESEISKVDAAAVEINVDDVTSDVNILLPIHLYDEAGEILDTTKITMSKSEVSTTATILETKDLPVKCTYTGKLLDGYIATGKIDCDPSIVTVAGRSSLVKNLEYIDASEAIDITGSDSDVTESINLNEYLPDGVSVVGGVSAAMANVTVHIEKEDTADLQITTERIHVTGVPEGYTASLDESDQKIDIQIAGLKSEITKVNGEELVGIVDLEKYMRQQEITHLTEGTYLIPVDITFDNNTRLSRELKVHVVVKGD